MVGSGHCDEMRLMLPLVSLPKKSITFLNAPLAGGLLRLDVEVEMRPAAAAAFLTEHPELLSLLDVISGTDRGVDGLQVYVTIEPPLRIKDIDAVARVLSGVRKIRIFRQSLAAGRMDQPFGCSEALEEPFEAANIEAGVIVDFARRGEIATIDKGRL